MQRRPATDTIIGVTTGVACAATSTLVWRVVEAQQRVWPFPALYFLELILVAVLVAGAFLGRSRHRALAGWLASGITLSFAILGAWTVGLLFLPMAVGYMAAGLVSDWQSKAMGRDAALGALTAVIQGALMIAMAMRF